MSAPADAARILRVLRRRMIVQSWLNGLATSALIMGAVLVVVVPILRGVGSISLWEVLIAGGFGTLLLSLPLTRWYSTKDAAEAIDAMAGTRDRFVTVLSFGGDERVGDPMRELATRECLAFLEKTNFRPLARLRMPSRAPWIVVPLIVLALLEWQYQAVLAQRRADAASAQAQVADTIGQLEQLAKAAEEAQKRTESEEMKRIAEELKRSTETLRGQSKPEDAEKAALRELSALEQMLRDMKAPPATDEELKELAKALAKHEETKDAAKALDEGNLSEAAKALEQAEQKLAESGDPKAEEKLEESIKEAMERLQKQRQLSQLMEQFMNEMQKEDGAGQKLMQKLAQMLQQMPQQQGGSQPGKQGKQPSMEQMIQSLLSAIESMKNGQQPQIGQGEGNQQNPIMMQAFGQDPGREPQSADASQRQPSGKPGGDMDIGTTQSPFGEGRSEAAEKDTDLALKGRLGEGESLSLMSPNAGDSSKAQQRYRELYEAAAADAEEAIQQENIPLGSRFFIKRYFESIRPRQ